MADEYTASSPHTTPAQQASRARTPREENAIYQKDRIVARVNQADVDRDAKEVRFEEIYNSDELVIADECEFGKNRILIEKITYAIKVDPHRPQRGRVLRGVSADILGYHEQ